MSNGPSTASVNNLQKFLDTFVCAANNNGTGYFFFEVFDEPWKVSFGIYKPVMKCSIPTCLFVCFQDAQFGGVEGWWGLFTAK
jgi:hypothetical protein